MDDHDGTGIPGEDGGEAAQTQPDAQRKAGPKPAVKAGRTAARTRKAAQPPAAGGRTARSAPTGKPAVSQAAAPAGGLTQGPAEGAQAPTTQATAPEPAAAAAPAEQHGPVDAAVAEPQAAAAGTVPATPPQAAASGPGATAGKGAAAKAAPLAEAAAQAAVEAAAVAATASAEESGEPAAAAKGQAASPAQAQAAPATRPGPAAKGQKSPAAAGSRTAPAGQSTPAGQNQKAGAAKTAKAVPGGRAKPAAQGVQGRQGVKRAAQNPQPVAAQKAAAAKPAHAAAASAEATEHQEAAAVTEERSATLAAASWQVPGYIHELDLGTGPSGRVVRARHEASGTPVEITYLSAALIEDSAFREAFRGEAELLGAVDSPYLARIHAYAEDGPHAAVVSEAVDGAGLDALLREKGAMAPEAALSVLRGSLLGLAAGHAAGVLHRAFEPANVVVNGEGAVKLADFGLAARSGGEGTGAATSLYAAPERRAGGPATEVSDLYAAAAVFHLCLTGTAPTAPAMAAPTPEPAQTTQTTQTAQTEKAAQTAQAAAPAQPADTSAAPADADSRIPEPLRALVARGLADTPTERPQAAADFAAELEAVAVATYGEDWEERGRLGLAELVVLVPQSADQGTAATAPQPLPAAEQVAAAPIATAAGSAAVAAVRPAGTPAAPAGKGPGGGAGNGPTGNGPGGGKPRFGRRAKIIAVTAAGVIVAGALAVTAVATGSDDDASAAVQPTPAAATSLTSAPAAAATSPSAEATTASPTASPRKSPTATAPTPTHDDSPNPTDQPTTDAPSTPASSPATPPSTPASPSTDPTKPAGSDSGSHIASVSITGIACTPGGHSATATVLVRYDGTAAGKLHLTWWRSSSGKPQGGIEMSPHTAKLPEGATSYTFTDKLTFTPDHNHPYVGLTVSTDPAAASGNGSSTVGCR